MKIQIWRVLLLPLFVTMILWSFAALAEEDISEWNTENAKPVSEADGTEGFGIDIGLKSQGADTSEEISVVSETDQTAEDDLEGQEALESGKILEGIIDVDPSLNIRTGPWGRIIGSLNPRAPIKIVAKEGDWFKILHGEDYAYVHAYYVDAPGFPPHQGIEPPILGSNQSPDGTIYSSAGGAGAGGAALLGYLQQAGITGEALKMAWAIGMAESGGDPGAFNGDSSTGDMSYGLFQINMLGDLGPERMTQYGLSCYEDLFDPATNIRVMVQMSANCSDWGPWSTYKRGNHEKFLSQFPP